MYRQRIQVLFLVCCLIALSSEKFSRLQISQFGGAALTENNCLYIWSSIMPPTSQGCSFKSMFMTLRTGIAIGLDGHVYGWGNLSTFNVVPIAASQLQTGSILSDLQFNQPFDSVAICETAIIALSTTSGLWGVGMNTYGELGVGDTTPRTALVNIDAGNDWKSVYCSGRTAFALKNDGTLYGWGDNTNGWNYGDGTTNTYLIPTEIAGAPKLTVLSPGFGPLPCPSAVDVNGSLWYWGQSSSTMQKLASSATIPTTWRNVWSRSCGYIGQADDGTLWGAGLGPTWDISTSTDRSWPALVLTTAFSPVVAAFAHCVLAQTNSGKVVGWGENYEAQLGPQKPAVLTPPSDYTTVTFGCSSVPCTSCQTSDWAFVGGTCAPICQQSGCQSCTLPSTCDQQGCTSGFYQQTSTSGCASCSSCPGFTNATLTCTTTPTSAPAFTTACTTTGANDISAWLTNLNFTYAVARTTDDSVVLTMYLKSTRLDPCLGCFTPSLYVQGIANYVPTILYSTQSECPTCISLNSYMIVMAVTIPRSSMSTITPVMTSSGAQFNLQCYFYINPNVNPTGISNQAISIPLIINQNTQVTSTVTINQQSSTVINWVPTCMTASCIPPPTNNVQTYPCADASCSSPSTQTSFTSSQVLTLSQALPPASSIPGYSLKLYAVLIQQNGGSNLIDATSTAVTTFSNGTSIVIQLPLSTYQGSISITIISRLQPTRLRLLETGNNTNTTGTQVVSGYTISVVASNSTSGAQSESGANMKWIWIGVGSGAALCMAIIIGTFIALRIRKRMANQKKPAGKPANATQENQRAVEGVESKEVPNTEIASGSKQDMVSSRI